MDKGGKVFLGLIGATAVIGVIVLTTRPTQAAPPGTKADVLGQVLDQFNNPVAAVTVTLGDIITSTNNNGNFLFSGIDIGDYSMSFVKAGYQTVIK